MGYIIEKYHGGYNIQPRRDSVKYIVVHYVGDGDSSAGSARRNCMYFAGGNRQASAHYFIDDGNIYEYADPSTHATWHCGDGHGKYGITNQNSIGIEVCNNGGPYTDNEVARLTWLTQKLMSDFGVPADHIVRHYDASRKECPLYYVQNPAEWDKLRAQITGGAVPSTTDNGFGDTNYTGPLMVSEWQRQLGTPVDGCISGQTAYNANTLQWAITVSPAANPARGSQMVIALQKFLNAHGYSCGAADGHMGLNTIKALQRFLNDAVGAGLVVDGYFGHATSRALAIALSQHKFAA